MANKHMKRCSILLIIGQMQIKTTMRYSPHTNQNGHHQKKKKKKTTNDKCWRRCGKKGTLLHCWWECRLIQPLYRTVWRFVNKLGTELRYEPATRLLGIYPEKSTIQNDACTHCSLQHYVQ